MHKSKWTPFPQEKKITVSLSALGLPLIVLPPLHGAFSQAGANYPKQSGEKKGSAGTNNSHFTASVRFPEITLNYFLNLDAQLILPQMSAKAPQRVAWLFFLTHLYFFLTSQVWTQSLKWEAAV